MQAKLKYIVNQSSHSVYHYRIQSNYLHSPIFVFNSPQSLKTANTLEDINILPLRLPANKPCPIPQIIRSFSGQDLVVCEVLFFGLKLFEYRRFVLRLRKIKAKQTSTRAGHKMRFVMCEGVAVFR